MTYHVVVQRVIERVTKPAVSSNPSKAAALLSFPPKQTTRARRRRARVADDALQDDEARLVRSELRVGDAPVEDPQRVVVVPADVVEQST